MLATVVTTSPAEELSRSVDRRVMRPAVHLV